MPPPPHHLKLAPLTQRRAPSSQRANTAFAEQAPAHGDRVGLTLDLTGAHAPQAKESNMPKFFVLPSHAPAAWPTLTFTQDALRPVGASCARA